MPAPICRQEISRALKGVRRHLAEHAGKRAAAADEVRAAAARLGLGRNTVTRKLGPGRKRR